MLEWIDAEMKRHEDSNTRESYSKQLVTSNARVHLCACNECDCQVMRNIADYLESKGYTMPEKDKQKYQKIRRWLDAYRKGKTIRAIGRPKDSNADTSAKAIEATDRHFETTGFAAQVNDMQYIIDIDIYNTCTQSDNNRNPLCMIAERAG